ncbi:MAG TPA: type II toxin-antitoxin system RelE/ParE family toxin [Thermoanaerobaculia bacterium]|nr:type II toxin-antitoxin system RelE/ParE family toxin [Thermoanaerobaculia bacterium]
MKVRFTPSARQELLAVLAYIRRDRPEAARRLRERAEESLRRLEQLPDSGRHIPEFPGLPYREVIVTPYRFFYRVAGDTAWIVAVWHGAQIPDPPA